VRGDLAYDLETEKAALRLRLAAVALATTLALLAGTRADASAAVTIPMLLATAVALRYLAPRLAAEPRAVAGGIVDLVAATAIVYALPIEEPAWVLYGFVVANTALRNGPIGAFVATAGSIIGYDVVLSLRAGVAGPESVWVVQALVAIGLIGAELAWSARRASMDRGRIRRHAHALRALTRVDGVDAVLDALGVQLRAVGAEDVRFGTDAEALRRSFGARAGLVEPLATTNARFVAVTLPSAAAAAGVESGVRDLLADAVAVIVANEKREQDLRTAWLRTAALEAVATSAREATEAGALATLTLAASRIANRAALVRLADGVLLTGDVPRDAAVELAREAGTAALLRRDGAAWSRRCLTQLDATSAVVVSAGQGRALLALAGDRELDADDLATLQALASGAGAVADTLREQDRLRRESRELRTEVERVSGALQAREDAVAMAVHELRNPLTSVHGYATLMTRNLTAVQGQMRRLEQILADLLGRSAFAGEGIADVRLEAREAASRLRALTGRDAAITAPAEPTFARIGSVRLAQVLDNLLRNAAKYSPEDSPIDVEIARGATGVRVTVRDTGTGIDQGDLEHLFDRGFRSARHASIVGEGLGLAVCRQIVEAQGGRIWAESAGRDRGSVFYVEVPEAVPAPARG
jgi:signal transduction histidine kinase